MNSAFSSRQSVGTGKVKAVFRYALILLLFPILVVAGDRVGGLRKYGGKGGLVLRFFRKGGPGPVIA